MKARMFAMAAILAAGISIASAKGISVNVTSRPAEEVFSQIMDQSDVNFVYASDVLKGIRVTVSAKDEPLAKVLERMFSGTGVSYRIKGNVVTLKRKPIKQKMPGITPGVEVRDIEVSELPEVTVIQSRNRDITMKSSDVGHLNLSRATIASTPTLFGESDVIKTLQLQPGVSAGTEGLAGMYVHGGSNDENLYMLDNIPLYQINHFGGLFSAFNTETIKNVDFYKSTFPTRYDGRLSSVMDVHTKDGSLREHHGSFKLGLTSGAINIDGPIFRDKTSYSLAIRRSWYDVLSVPGLAIFNKMRQEKEATTVARYAFTDINAKIRHIIDDNTQARAMFYYGNDYLKGGTKNKYVYDEEESGDKDISRLNWGNLVASAGLERRFSSTFTGELTAAYTHYRSKLRRNESQWNETDYESKSTTRIHETRNDIHDWTLRADMVWKPVSAFNMTFGANFTAHSYTPEENRAWLYRDGAEVSAVLDMQHVMASEWNVYTGGDWDPAARLRISAGASLSMYDIDGRMHKGINPRASMRWLVNDNVTVKAAYSKMSQYVHQLTTSSLSLPTDQWVPIAGGLKPQRSDKVSVGAYWKFHEDIYDLSGEVYFKWMDNVIDYRDDWALLPADTPWAQRLCAGTARAKGFDLMLSKRAGKFTGHAAYSLLFADRRFEQKNQGHRYPSRFDNRHKINVLLNWRINDKWEVNASWTGMSGNRITLSTQDYELLDAPNMPHTDTYYEGRVDMNASTNNFRLPFYHRMDVGVNRYTKRGLWNFSLYNAYCNLNAISIRKDRTFYRFEMLRLIPILPSVSYTWLF